MIDISFFPVINSGSSSSNIDSGSGLTENMRVILEFERSWLQLTPVLDGCGFDLR